MEGVLAEAGKMEVDLAQTSIANVEDPEMLGYYWTLEK
jgi:hypothetical protein